MDSLQSLQIAGVLGLGFRVSRMFSNLEQSGWLTSRGQQVPRQLEFFFFGGGRVCVHSTIVMEAIRGKNLK